MVMAEERLYVPQQHLRQSKKFKIHVKNAASQRDKFIDHVRKKETNTNNKVSMWKEGRVVWSDWTVEGSTFNLLRN